jgi:hypothetical protein
MGLSNKLRVGAFLHLRRKTINVFMLSGGIGAQNEFGGEGPNASRAQDTYTLDKTQLSMATSI